MSRAFIKVCSYSVMHLIVAVSVAYCLTRDWHVAFAVGLVEPLFQTIAFSLHEEAWKALNGADKTRAAP